MAFLQVRNLRKKYGGFTALSGVSFSVDTGEVFGLLGPNGAGKTTLLSILAGLSEDYDGEILVAGRVFDPEDASQRPLLGVVPQDLALYPELTARENLHFFGEIYGVGTRELTPRIDRILAAVGLTERKDHAVATFSGGMKRRLNLGIALVHEPRILLLDEPTTGVDPQSRNHIFEEVRRLQREGLAIVYTSHYMEEVESLCSRIGIIDQGRLVACDALAGLLRLLPGRIRIQSPGFTERFLSRVAEVSRVTHDGDGHVDMEAAEVQTLVLSVMKLALEENVELTGLRFEEPNLERVFLHLTGRDLRD